MRLFFCLVFLVAVSSAEIKIKVVDPHASAVSGAQVILLNGDAPVSTQTTGSDGVAVFQNTTSASRVRALAPGFTPAEAEVALAMTEHLLTQLARSA